MNNENISSAKPVKPKRGAIVVPEVSFVEVACAALAVVVDLQSADYYETMIARYPGEDPAVVLDEYLQSWNNDMAEAADMIELLSTWTVIEWRGGFYPEPHDYEGEERNFLPACATLVEAIELAHNHVVSERGGL